MTEIKKKYDEIKKKYKLPDFDSLNREFDIATIDEKEDVLTGVRSKIEGKIEQFLKILNVVIEPDTNISDLYECKMFSDENKKKIFELYRKLMIMKRSSTLIDIDPDDKGSAELINSVHKEWDSVKAQMKGIVDKMKESWEKDTKVKEELGYFG